MRSLWFLVIVIAANLSIGSETLRAEQPFVGKAAPLSNMKAELPRFVRIMEAFGKGEMDQALDLVEKEVVGMPSAETKTNSPFEPSLREVWRQQFTKFSELHPRFESIDLIGYQPISSAARELVFIGHGYFGPVLFRIRTFRYRGKWKIHAMMYKGEFKYVQGDIESASQLTRFEKPIHFPLRAAAVAQKAD